MSCTKAGKRNVMDKEFENHVHDSMVRCAVVVIAVPVFLFIYVPIVIKMMVIIIYVNGVPHPVIRCFGDSDLVMVSQAAAVASRAIVGQWQWLRFDGSGSGDTGISGGGGDSGGK